ncbi:glycosyltransferase [Desulfohalovibrio reitneri]|uniref:glycosyltransferase n=1 Tax=Desulfohalovibrio reitneri TaxID=1307759 RepID=UPI00054D6C42|nr:glycosyltransferase [Desulfohalovibrio reitneri]
MTPDPLHGLPSDLRAVLLRGGLGRDSLLAAVRTGNAALERLTDPDQRAATSRVSRHALLAAWEAAPFNGELAQHARDMAETPDPARDAVLAEMAARRKPPQSLAYYQRLMARRDGGKVLGFLAGRLAEEPENSFWWDQAYSFGLFAAEPEWFEDHFYPRLPDSMASLAARVRGDSLLSRDRLEEAEAAYAGAGESVWVLSARAEARRRLGGRDEAADLLRQAVRFRPWQVHLPLRLYDLATGRDRETAPLDGDVAVLLYSYGKPDLLDATLSSLFASDLPDGARVVVLDNGSGGRTPEVLDSWRQCACGRIETVELPVNVGAAAARNWLSSLPSVQAAAYCCYLDDDVDLPPDWLARLGAAVRAHPEAYVWGCKVVEHGSPHVVQHADLHLMPEGDPAQPESEDFRVAGTHTEAPDLGQFGYIRPCLSVTGCCHLFRTAELLEGGPFSIHLSPSQYDDLERDLRLAARGRYAAYQGFLSVRHKKGSGKASLSSASEDAGARGNAVKLKAMHPLEEARQLMVEDADRLAADLAAKLREVTC